MIKPLSELRRRLYLMMSVLAFIALIPIILLYSEGYRLGDAFSLVETGGIYVRSDVADTSLYVNGALKKETGLLIRNSFIDDLRPGMYEIRVEKDGYRSWVKRVRVDENLVTDVNHLPVLTEIASTTVRRYLPATSTEATPVRDPRHAELVRLFASSTATTTPKAVVGKSPTSTASTTALDPRTLMPGFRDHRGIYAWIERGRVTMTWPGSYERTPYFFCQGKECIATSTLALPEEIVAFEWLPSQADGLVVVTESGAYVVDADVRSAPNVYPIVSGKNIKILVDGADIIFKIDDEFVVAEI
jgi:hypothetical protein